MQGSTSKRSHLRNGLLLALVLNVILAPWAQAAAGDLDSSFDTDGKVTTDFSAADNGFAVAIQLDGKIVAAGASGGNFALARYNTDGSLDTGFDSDGKVITDFGASDLASGVAIQLDGKIVAAGNDGADFALARYNSDGSLDTGFDSDGKVTTDFGSTSESATDVAIQPDGRIVAAGFSGTDFALARYNTDGSLHTGFDSDGKVTTDFASSSDTAHDVALQPDDGKIVAAGNNGPDFALARYNTDGSLDTGFDSDGKVTTDFASSSDGAFGVAIRPINGRIVAAGDSTQPGTGIDFALARYNTDGSLDTSFDSDGKVTTDFASTPFDLLRGVAMRPNGRIVAVGCSGQGAGQFGDWALARYNTDGSLDTSFDSDGKVTTDLGHHSECAQGVAFQPDGRIVAAGVTADNFGLARYLVDVTAPAITLTTPPDGAVYDQNQMVLADYACQDEVGGSGLASCIGDVPDASAIDTSTLGSHSFTVDAEDNDGNMASVTHNYSVVDVTAPTITLTTPPDGAVYGLNQTVFADYSCQDEAGGSGLASCIGDVPDASAIDTSTVGSHFFTVDAGDNAGNMATVTHTYYVRYTFAGFFSPIDNEPTFNRAKAGQVIAVKWRLTDHNGVPISDPASFVSLTSASTTCDPGDPTDTIETYAGSSGLQYMGDGNWQFNWKTAKSYAGNCRVMRLNLADGTTHTAKFQFT